MIQIKWKKQNVLSLIMKPWHGAFKDWLPSAYTSIKLSSMLKHTHECAPVHVHTHTHTPSSRPALREMWLWAQIPVCHEFTVWFGKLFSLWLHHWSSWLSIPEVAGGTCNLESQWVFPLLGLLETSSAVSRMLLSQSSLILGWLLFCSEIPYRNIGSVPGSLLSFLYTFPQRSYASLNLNMSFLCLKLCRGFSSPRQTSDDCQGVQGLYICTCIPSDPNRHSTQPGVPSFQAVAWLSSLSPLGPGSLLPACLSAHLCCTSVLQSPGSSSDLNFAC